MTGQYRWKFTDGGPNSTLSLELVSGTDVMNLAKRPVVYGADDEVLWNPKCTMKMGLTTAESFVKAAQLVCSTCLLPVHAGCLQYFYYPSGADLRKYPNVTRDSDLNVITCCGCMGKCWQVVSTAPSPYGGTFIMDGGYGYNPGAPIGFTPSGFTKSLIADVGYERWSGCIFGYNLGGATSPEFPNGNSIAIDMERAIVCDSGPTIVQGVSITLNGPDAGPSGFIIYSWAAPGGFPPPTPVTAQSRRDPCIIPSPITLTAISCGFSNPTAFPSTIILERVDCPIGYPDGPSSSSSS